MEKTIKIIIPSEDADMIEHIFNTSENPQFTVLKRSTVEGTTCDIVEIYTESTINFWYLAKRVQLY